MGSSSKDGKCIITIHVIHIITITIAIAFWTSLHIITITIGITITNISIVIIVISNIIGIVVVVVVVVVVVCIVCIVVQCRLHHSCTAATRRSLFVRFKRSIVRYFRSYWCWR